MRTSSFSLLGSLVLALSACGGSSAASTTTSVTPKISISATNYSTYGEILTSSKGQTYYMFNADTGKKSACSGACTGVWPPVVVSSLSDVEVMGQVEKSELATIVRSDGKLQLSYGEHPLYTYVSDSGPNMVNGEGVNSFGAAWYVLSVKGQPIRAAHSATNSY